MKDPTQSHELHPKPWDVLTGGELEAQRGTGSILSHTAITVMVLGLRAAPDAVRGFAHSVLTT